MSSLAQTYPGQTIQAGYSNNRPPEQEGISSVLPRVHKLAADIKERSWSLRENLGLFPPPTPNPSMEKGTRDISKPTLFSTLREIESFLGDAQENLAATQSHLNS